MRLSVLSFALFLTACTRTPVSQEAPAPPAPASIAAPGAPEKRSYIRQQIDLLDSVRYADYFDDQLTMLDSVNKNIYQALKGLTKDDAYQTAPLGETDGISYLLSDDKKFCLISWDTRMGGTMIDYVAAVIYKSNTGTKITLLGKTNLDTDAREDITYFSELYTLTDSGGKTTYFAYGFGRASTRYPWRKLRAFRIAAETLDQTLPTFNDRDNTFRFDLSKFDESGDLPEIIVSPDHRDVQIPEIKDEVPTGRFIKYHFSNGIYCRVE